MQYIACVLPVCFDEVSVSPFCPSIESLVLPDFLQSAGGCAGVCGGGDKGREEGWRGVIQHKSSGLNESRRYNRWGCHFCVCDCYWPMCSLGSLMDMPALGAP